VRFKIFFLWFVALLFSALLLCALFRDKLLHFAFEKVQQKFITKYNASLHVADVNFVSFNRIALKELTVIPALSDTLLSIASADAKFSISNLLIGKVVLYDMNADSIMLTVFNSASKNNIKHFTEKGTKVQDEKKEAPAPVHTRLMKKLERYLQTSFTFKNIAVSYSDSTQEEKVFLPVVQFRDNSFRAVLVNGNSPDTLDCSGVLDFKKKNFNATISTNGNEDFTLPLLDKIDSLRGGFKTFHVQSSWNEQNETLQLNTSVDIAGLHLQHWRLSSEKVSIPHLKFSGSISFTNNSVQLDSTSQFQIGNTPVTVFARYQQIDTSRILALKVQMPEIAADTLFSSLPTGMFKSLKGISCNGTLAYRLNFAMDTRALDSLVFDSELQRKGLSLRHYGAEHFSRIENDFIHDVYVKGVKVRQLNISHDNPYFTSLRQINPYLISSVLQAEDPSFMRHNGFLESAFRESIIQNIKEKRFARGGSTITMQLVKNVFLNRDKNIARKVEEAMIVYLIENLNLVSKERMLEVYLNIIEWGPNVYGIGEASRFYFKKKPSELSLSESIFLAGIVPRPRAFKYHVEKDGTLKPHFTRFFEVLSNRMVLREIISPEDAQKITYKLKFKGEALQHISPEEAMPEEEDFY